MKLEYVYLSSTAFREYMVAYLAKRQSDCVGEPVRDGNRIIYSLLVGLPRWIKHLVGADMGYHESVCFDTDASSATVKAGSGTEGATVNVSMVIASQGTGTRVTCVVELEPSYRNIPIPVGPIRVFINSCFKKERRRDELFISRCSDSKMTR